MLPREIVRYIFLFQKMYRYGLKFNTLYSLKKIKKTLSTFHPPRISIWGDEVFQSSCSLPITKNKFYYINYYSWTRSPYFSIAIIEKTGTNIEHFLEYTTIAR